MTIISCDVKALEINVCAYLSQDKTMCDEIRNKFDLHSDNQRKFGLPTRLIAKTMVFRLIYGGTAYAYTVDPEFMEVSTSTKFWQKVIDKFYEKYPGVFDWHAKIIATAMETGQLVMPTGRVFTYTPKEHNGELHWPITTIKNYPVQGTGADIVAIARILFHKAFHQHKIQGKLISTVHDSIVSDVEDKEVPRVTQLLYETFEKVPKTFANIFGVEYNLPVFCEISVGPNLKDLVEI